MVAESALLYQRNSRSEDYTRNAIIKPDENGFNNNILLQPNYRSTGTEESGRGNKNDIHANAVSKNKLAEFNRIPITGESGRVNDNGADGGYYPGPFKRLKNNLLVKSSFQTDYDEDLMAEEGEEEEDDYDFENAPIIKIRFKRSRSGDNGDDLDTSDSISTINLSEETAFHPNNGRQARKRSNELVKRKRRRHRKENGTAGGHKRRGVNRMLRKSWNRRRHSNETTANRRWRSGHRNNRSS